MSAQAAPFAVLTDIAQRSRSMAAGLPEQQNSGTASVLFSRASAMLPPWAKLPKSCMYPGSPMFRGFGRS